MNYQNRKTFKTGRIFDLDGTVIDSFHRVAPCLNEKGDLNLQKYKNEACTHEKVMQDRLLPLVGLMKESIRKGELVIIVTARLMSKSDYVYLRQNGIRVPLICERGTIHKHFAQQHVNRIYKSGDGDYKAAWFGMIKGLYPNTAFTMYDDHPCVLKAATGAGFTAVDAVSLNEALGYALEDACDSLFNEMLEDNADCMDIMYDSLLGA